MSKVGWGVPGDRRRQNFFEIEVITLGNPLIFLQDFVLFSFRNLFKNKGFCIQIYFMIRFYKNTYQKVGVRGPQAPEKILINHNQFVYFLKLFVSKISGLKNYRVTGMNWWC